MSKGVLYWSMVGIGLPAGLYVIALLTLYLAQGRLLFFPAEIDEATLHQYAKTNGATVISLTAKDGTRLQAWHHPAGGERLVIYAHGNAGLVADAMPLKQMLQRRGVDVLSVGYRGFPGSDGVPTEVGLKQDLLAIYDYAIGRLGVAPERIVLHGRSLGGGVVGTAMLDLPVAGLVMESTFTSAADRAAELYPIFPVRALMTNPFDTRSRAANLTVPVWLVHSTDDEVIPIHHARALHDTFPNSDLFEVSGYGHNDDVLSVQPNALAAYLAFLDQVTR
jgi:pimeloyl-ACP methyl ester carboxylesterase